MIADMGGTEDVRAVLAADAAGFTAAAIGRSFGLSRTSVTRVLFRDADRQS